ncbi:hypothetical protein H8356DRAFT_1741527 [Neocallimastix lanati (nom. inval.)]|nr:hypothetical protein H8356DRAFT_1741527 [Neocallimastix sp. JGI-2020a]
MSNYSFFNDFNMNSNNSNDNNIKEIFKLFDDNFIMDMIKSINNEKNRDFNLPNHRKKTNYLMNKSINSNFDFRPRNVHFKTLNSEEEKAKYIVYLPNDLIKVLDLIQNESSNILLFNASSEDIMGIKENKPYESFLLVNLIKKISKFRIKVYINNSSVRRKKEEKENRLMDPLFEETNIYQDYYDKSWEKKSTMISDVKNGERYANQKDQLINELSNFKFIDINNSISSSNNNTNNNNNKKSIEKYHIKLLHTLIMFYLLKGCGPDPKGKKKLLPGCIKNLLKEDYETMKSMNEEFEKIYDKDRTKSFETEKDLAEMVSFINLKEEDLKQFLKYPLDEIPVKKKNKVLKYLPCSNILDFYQYIVMSCKEIPVVELSRIDRAFLNFSLLASYCNIDLYNLEFHPDWEENNKNIPSTSLSSLSSSSSSKSSSALIFQKKIMTLIAIVLGKGSYMDFQKNMKKLTESTELKINKKILKELMTLSNHQENQDLFQHRHPHEFINPRTDKPWKANDPIITKEEFIQWLRAFVFQKNWKIPYYNDFSVKKVISMPAIVKGIGLDEKGLEYNEKHANWEKMKKKGKIDKKDEMKKKKKMMMMMKEEEEEDSTNDDKNQLSYEDSIKKAKETHKEIEVKEEDLNRLISKLFFLKLDAEAIRSKYNNRHKNNKIEGNVELLFS